MAGEKTVETTGLLGWLDRRFPVTSTWKAHLSEYYAPKNFNFWYFFGSLALLVLVLQIVTGIFLVMHYKPDAERAFQSVEYIMREVPWAGWCATCTRPAPRCSSSWSTCTRCAGCSTVRTASRANWSGSSASRSSSV